MGSHSRGNSCTPLFSRRFSRNQSPRLNARQTQARVRFLIARRVERVKLAESAAPPEISGKATAYVLDPTGYVKVRDGENGFSCFVDRQTPLNLEPTCFDAEGSATTFPTRILVEECRAKGEPEDQINAEIESGYKSGKFLVPRKPGIVSPVAEDFLPDQNYCEPETEDKIVGRQFI